MLQYILESTIYHWLGLLGAVLYVLTFAALQFDMISSDDMAFPGGRLIASICVMAGLSVEFNLATLVISATYMVISLYGLLRLARLRMRMRQDDPAPLAAQFPIAERI